MSSATEKLIYDKYKDPKSSDKPLSNGEEETPNEAKVIEELLLKAKKITDWGSRTSQTRPLKRITNTKLFGFQGDTFLLQLI